MHMHILAYTHIHAYEEEELCPYFVSHAVMVWLTTSSHHENISSLNKIAAVVLHKPR